MMRHLDPHDAPRAKQRPEPYRGQPVTLGHMRAHGVRRLLIYCSTGLCHHSATIEADRWPDDTAVRDLCPKAVCTKCGMIGADVRPEDVGFGARKGWPRSGFAVNIPIGAMVGCGVATGSHEGAGFY
jgi:hypothetical protein